MNRNEFQRGVIAAASAADLYNSSTTHPYRLGDCLLAKLNVVRRKPRRNKHARPSEHDVWLRGFATALAEMHRRLLNGNDSASVCRVAYAGELTLKSARAAGVSSFDLKELRKAGVR